jgi:hypothetical protein
VEKKLWTLFCRRKVPEKKELEKRKVEKEKGAKFREKRAQDGP